MNVVSYGICFLESHIPFTDKLISLVYSREEGCNVDDLQIELLKDAGEDAIYVLIALCHTLAGTSSPLPPVIQSVPHPEIRLQITAL